MEHTLICEPAMIVALLFLYIIVLSREYKMYNRRKRAKGRIEASLAHVQGLKHSPPHGSLNDAPSTIKTQKRKYVKPIKKNN